MKVVAVSWVDAMRDESHSVPLECINAMVPIKRSSVGYLMVEDETKVIIVSGTLDNLHRGETAYDSPMVIPRGMVMDMRELE